jgi:DNA-binding transcriptional MerR regulator
MGRGHAVATGQRARCGKEVTVPAKLLSIGEFSARSRLSPKALRLYDELGLLIPAQVDPSTGYRWYAPTQIARARLVALLRHLDMPLSRIAHVTDLDGPAAAATVRAFWLDIEHGVQARAAIVDRICHLLQTGSDAMDSSFVVAERAVPDRAVLSALRQVCEGEAGATMGELLGRMRAAAGGGLAGADGCPFAIVHGAVSADSDGPMEIVRPCADLASAEAAANTLGDVQARTDPAHDEAFVRLTLPQTRWPAQLDALAAIEAHLKSAGRSPAGPPRQIMIADWRTVGDDEPACLLAVPLMPV